MVNRKGTKRPISGQQNATDNLNQLKWIQVKSGPTARFSKKSPWSVFRGDMSWNHGETFTAKINKLGPKCRWNILIAGDNTAAKIIRVYTYM